MISSRSTGKKLKDKPDLQLYFIAIILMWNLYFLIAFISGSLILWLTGSVSLYWEIPSVIMILEINSFKTDSVFLSFSIMLSSSFSYYLNLFLRKNPLLFLFVDKSLDGISSLIYNKIPPIFPLLSKRKGAL